MTAKYQVGRRAQELGEAMRKVELAVAGAGLARRAVTSGVAPADPAPTIPVTAGAQTAVLPETGRIGTLAASPDGAWIATGSLTTEIKLWNAIDGQPRGHLSGHDSEISALQFCAGLSIPQARAR